MAGAPGLSDVTIVGVATGANGISVPLEFQSTRIVVR